MSTPWPPGGFRRWLVGVHHPSWTTACARELARTFRAYLPVATVSLPVMPVHQSTPDVQPSRQGPDDRTPDSGSVFTAPPSQASPSLPSPQTIAEVLW